MLFIIMGEMFCGNFTEMVVCLSRMFVSQTVTDCEVRDADCVQLKKNKQETNNVFKNSLRT